MTVTNMKRASVEPAIRQYLAPCQVRCPIHEDIQRTNVLISLLPQDPQDAREKLLEIGDYLYEKNPLFTVCGYVCGLCELECNYSSQGGAIRRRLLKRYISDSYTYYLDEKEEFELTKSKENVAVIGGGFAGMTAAYELGKQGYQTFLFERMPELGGLAGTFPIEGTRLERGYHHWFTSDTHIVAQMEHVTRTTIQHLPRSRGMRYHVGISIKLG